VSVAAHLKIRLSEYDRRIRTFIPHYQELLDVVAGAAALGGARAPLIVDLGIGTGALAARCLDVAPRAQIYGIDEDPAMLGVAAKRLARRGKRHDLVAGSFARLPLPRCDAMVATLSLHHVKTVVAKRRLYRRSFQALKSGGILASGDAMLSSSAPLRRHEMAAWRAHMRQWYSARQARGFLAAWASEDRYMPLAVEVKLLESAGFRVDVPWRRAPFAVVVGTKQ
jgi:SAM-dependent methyltransferase